MIDIKKTSPTNGHSVLDLSRGEGRGRGRGRGDGGGYNPPRRNRAEFSYSGPNHDRALTTIVVEQIPEEKFDEQLVRDFFSEFGNIQSITMQAYKRLALVQYDDYSAARRAYDSPKVIFDNRFVKVYWYKPDSVQSIPKPGTFSSSLPTLIKEEDQPFDKEKFERDAIVAQKRLEEKKAALKGAEAKRQALEKQKEELAQRQAEEKKKLLEKLAAKGNAGNMSPNTPSNAMNGHEANSAHGTDDSKVSAQTKVLRAQVAALEAEAKSLGLDTALSDDSYSPRGRRRGRGRGSYRSWEAFAERSSFRGNPRGRGGFRGRGGGAYNLDNRTKKVGVSGVEFTGEKDEGLRQYLLVSLVDHLQLHCCNITWMVADMCSTKGHRRIRIYNPSPGSPGSDTSHHVQRPLYGREVHVRRQRHSFGGQVGVRMGEYNATTCEGFEERGWRYRDGRGKCGWG